MSKPTIWNIQSRHGGGYEFTYPWAFSYGKPKPERTLLDQPEILRRFRTQEEGMNYAAKWATR